MNIKLFLFCTVTFVLSQINFAQAVLLDTDFGTEGIVITDIGGDDDGNAMALQDDGKIIVAGTTDTEFTKFALARYDNDGSLDESFGIAGIATYTLTDGLDVCNDVLIQSDGKILVVGYTFAVFGEELGPVDFMILRYNEDGTLDNTYGDDGVVTTDATGSLYPDGAFSAVLQGDDKMVVLGLQETDEASEAVLLRYNTDGSLDNTFGDDGVVAPLDIEFNDFSEEMNLVLDGDGKILVALSVNDDLAGVSNFWIGRYNADGTVDATFGDGGSTQTDIGTIAFDDSSDDLPAGIAVLADGKIILSGHTSHAFEYLSLVQYNADGTLDAAFGTDGVFTMEAPNSYVATCLTIQNDGRIITGGDAILMGDESRKFYITRHFASGELDLAFGEDGVLRTDVSSNEDLANDILVRPTGEIVIAGETDGDDFNSDFALVQYKVNPDFGVGIFENRSEQLNLSVYPNPILDQINLSYLLDESEVVTLQLVDLQGRIIYSYLDNEYRSAGEQNEQLSTPADLAPGAYQLILTMGSNHYSVQVIH